MKKILTLLLVAGLFSSTYAQRRSNGNNNQNNNGTYSNNDRYENTQNNNYQNSALVVNTNSQNGFTVSVDNGNTYPSNSNSVRLRTLSPGNHLVTVSEYTRSILGRQVPRVIYNSTITFRAGFETTLNIDANGQINITERQISGNGNGNGNGNNGKSNKYKNKKNKYPHDNRNHDKQKKNGNNNRNDRDDD